MKIGLLRETKIPIDKRVPFTPAQCLLIQNEFPNLEIVVQSSKIRTILDAEYKALGIRVADDISECDVLMGIKEVHPAEILPNKTYLIFSHTIKQQPANQKLLQAFARLQATLIDYECIRDSNGHRVVAFGFYAGIVGAYNTLRAYGLKYDKFDLPQAYLCETYHGLKQELQQITIPNIKIVITGGGRVANGVVQILSDAGIQRIDPHRFLSESFNRPVYTQLHSLDYHKPQKEAHNNDSVSFYNNPELYTSTFFEYATCADVLIAGAFWNPKAPVLFTDTQMKHPDFRIKVVGDITCDVNGSIPCTIKTSSIDSPYFDFNPFTFDEEVPFENKNNITVMAVDNLPCELSRDASHDFGEQLLTHVIPNLVLESPNTKLLGATILQHGVLTQPYQYLKNYLGNTK